jgi:hypothetical protein
MNRKGVNLMFSSFFFMLNMMKLANVSTSKMIVRGSAAKRLLHTMNGIRKGCMNTSFLSSSMNDYSF